MDQTFTIQAEHQGLRLDKYLNDQLPNQTRSQIKKQILQGLILLNNEVPSVHQFIKTGDIIVIKPQPEKPPVEVPTIQVIDEENGYVVIDKPAGVMTHEASSSELVPTVTSWLLQQYPQIATVGDENRPGIVHRLDTLTSGVMVAAKTNEMYHHLKNQFANREVEKNYIALVHGLIEDESGEISTFIGRSKDKGRMASRITPMNKKDRPAITTFKVVKRFPNHQYTLVEASPKTGRTHQIRVHFMSLGFPVAGDHLYKIKRQKKTVDLGRVFLHSKELSFKDLEGEQKTYSSPLPVDLLTFLQTID